jgi:glycosyltransferase involved in cell wall biosynthesis
MPLDINVTLVVPVLNEALSLLELLEAIKAQSHRPEELIFCDAGSSDGSHALIQEWWSANGWAGASLSVISLPGAMPGAGRNAGIRVARNNWIAFLDGGIIPAADWLSSLCRHVQNLSSEAVFGICYFAGCTVFPKAVCALSYGQGSTHPVIPASLFSKSVFEKVGYFPEYLRAGEDILWLNLFLAKYSTRDICYQAQVSYIHFPDSLLKAMRKWKMYEFYCVQANVRKGQQYIYLLSPLMLLFLISQSQVFAYGIGLLYFGLRGFIDPIRRSSDKPWWGQTPRAALIAPLLALLLDISKWLGIVQGMCFKIFKKLGSVK